MRGRGVVVLSVLIVAGLVTWRTTRPTPRPGPGGTLVASATSGTIAVHGSAFTVTGPFRHKNLSVFVLHSEVRDETDFLTLDDGLRDGSVEVSETPEQQVNELLIENRSARPLFVQVGDRLRGGKQDRIVGASFVVPPRSGKQPIRSFCIEHDRWVATEGCLSFACTVSSAVAPQRVRAAALAVDQQGVWKEVARSKGEVADALKAPNAQSTLNETIDSSEARRGMEAYASALGSILDRSSDAVGVVFVIDGKVEEVDVYPGRTILAKLYPRLLASFALQAATKASGTPDKDATVADVERFLSEGRMSSSRDESVLGNGCSVSDYDKKIESETRYGRDRFFMATGK